MKKINYNNYPFLIVILIFHLLQFLLVNWIQNPIIWNKKLYNLKNKYECKILVKTIREWREANLIDELLKNRLKWRVCLQKLYYEYYEE